MTRWTRPTFDAARAVAVACALWLALAANAAPGPMDFLFTSGKVPQEDNSKTSPRAIKFGEFSAIRLAPREAGATANAHPAQVNVDPLRSALAAVQYTTPAGKLVPLFGTAELTELAPALARALAAAGPDDDLLMFSTARREDGFLSTPYSLTARLFVQGGALQLIVHDARADIYSGFRGNGVVPVLGFGSRGAGDGAPVAIRSATADSRRADWLAIGLGASAAPALPIATSAGAAPAIAKDSIGAVARPIAAPEPATAARPRDAAFFDEQAQRLRGIKQLRDQNLISEEEYEQKRRDIMKSL